MYLASTGRELSPELDAGKSELKPHLADVGPNAWQVCLSSEPLAKQFLLKTKRKTRKERKLGFFISEDRKMKTVIYADKTVTNSYPPRNQIRTEKSPPIHVYVRTLFLQCMIVVFKKECDHARDLHLKLWVANLCDKKQNPVVCIDGSRWSQVSFRTSRNSDERSWPESLVKWDPLQPERKKETSSLSWMRAEWNTANARRLMFPSFEFGRLCRSNCGP